MSDLKPGQLAEPDAGVVEEEQDRRVASAVEVPAAPRLEQGRDLGRGDDRDRSLGPRGAFIFSIGFRLISSSSTHHFQNCWRARYSAERVAGLTPSPLRLARYDSMCSRRTAPAVRGHPLGREVGEQGVEGRKVDPSRLRTAGRL
ncbi:MAG TPA: hypothetical protein VLA23_05840 [Candidatus Limnocylindrales bacterium]|nr:hypothetical protein [Candidatus Limnocylindrales bacterium]